MELIWKLVFVAILVSVASADDASTVKTFLDTVCKDENAYNAAYMSSSQSDKNKLVTWIVSLTDKYINPMYYDSLNNALE